MNRSIGLVIGLVASLVFTIIILLTSIYQTQTGSRTLLFTNGSLTSVETEGLHFKIPAFQTIKHVDVTTQSTLVENLNAASRDLQVVSAAINVNWRIDANNLEAAYEQTRLNVQERVIDQRVKETLKAVSAKYTAEELIQNRQVVRDELEKQLTSELAKYHVIVEGVQLTNFEFSQAFNEAIEAKQTEVQNALKAKNILERTKIEAEQRIVQANAEAEAIRIQTEAIRSSGGAEYVQLKWIEKWNGKLPTTTGIEGIMIAGAPVSATKTTK